MKAGGEHDRSPRLDTTLMKPNRSDLSRATTRTPIVLVTVLVLLTALAGTVWAAWGPALLRAPGLAILPRAEATATPTRTPRPLTPVPTAVPLALDIVLPTATPQPVPTPQPIVTPEPLPADLAAIVARYGMDPERRFIVVDLAAQKMTTWDPHAGQPLRQMPVSTGDEARGYRTLAWYGLVGDYWGTFSSFGVYADEGWYLFQDAGSILIHGAPYKLVNGQKVYQDMDALGAYPASRGCIRLAPQDAIWFTQWQPQGVPIVILPRDWSERTGGD